MTWRIASWNVNSPRARLDIVHTWLSENPVDVLAIQETKVTDEDFPAPHLETLGYHLRFTGQKSYNGVAIFSKNKPHKTIYSLPEAPDDARRFIACEVDNTLVINVYVPNGQSLSSEKFLYKLAWLEALERYVKGAKKSFSRIIILGDFNIAPADIDVHDPIYWQDRILVSEAERAYLEKLDKLGFVDTFRTKNPNDAGFSWWDYRAGGFRRNHGLRIDLIFASTALTPDLQAVLVDREPRTWPKPSDHTPVIAEFFS